MKSHRYSFFFTISITALIVSLGYKLYNQIGEPEFIIIVFATFILLFTVAIFYLIKYFKDYQFYSILPLFFIIFAAILLLWNNNDFERVPDRFFNIDAVILNYDSLKFNLYQYKEEIMYPGAPYAIGESCIFDNYRRMGDIFIRTPFINGNWDIYIRKVNDASFKAYMTKLDIGTPDIIGDEKGIGCWPDSLAWQFYNKKLKNYEYKKVNKITIDFSKNMRNLEFFNSIIIE